MTNSVNKTVTNEELARMIAKGFSDVDKKFEDVDRRFDSVEKRLGKVEDGVINLNARMGRVETQVEEINQKLVPISEFDDLSSRVKYIERKLSIKSGR